MGIENEYSIYINGKTGVGNESIDKEIGEMISYARNKFGLSNKFQFLHNGARIYNDIGAPEFSTPECSSPKTLVAHDKAGELIIQEAAQYFAQTTGARIAIHKKNSDGFGHTYGCHENYSVSPELFDVLVDHPDNLKRRIWGTFLAVRQLITGAGKVGSEYSRLPCSFQISQRADFMEIYSSHDTTSNRPIIQMRDEPHANPNFAKRLHVIVGDANMCEGATYLKVGLSALMLRIMEDDFFTNFDLPVFHSNLPLLFKLISRDTEFKNTYEATTSRMSKQIQTTALDALELFLFMIKSYQSKLSKLEQKTFAEVTEGAEYALTQLRTGSVDKLFGFLDWPTKKVLAEKYLNKMSKNWEECLNDQQLKLDVRSLVDMAYTSINPEDSLYYSLMKAGVVKRIVSNDEINQAKLTPPHGRAKVRSLIMRKFGDAVNRIDWSVIQMKEGEKILTFNLPNPLVYNQLLEKLLTTSRTPTILALNIQNNRTLKEFIKIEGVS